MLRIELDADERPLFIALIGAIAGGGAFNPLYIKPELLDGQDRKIRRLIDKLYEQMQRGV